MFPMLKCLNNSGDCLITWEQCIKLLEKNQITGPIMAFVQLMRKI